MGPMCRRGRRVLGGAARVKRANGRDGHDGNTSGVKPRGCASPCSMASASCRGSAGVWVTGNRSGGRWQHEWREAKGLRFSLLDGERRVQVLSWHQVQKEHELGEALQQVKDAGVIPEEAVRLCVVCDGAEWIWKHVQALFPNACQVLDYYHCAEYLHKVAKAQYGQTFQALEWVEATLTRLYMGKVGTVLGGLRRMQLTSAEALKAIDNCWVYLNDHRGRTHYGKLRRGGYPLGSGGMESSNKFICHVRLKRSGAWWYEESSVCV